MLYIQLIAVGILIACVFIACVAVTQSKIMQCADDVMMCVGVTSPHTENMTKFSIT